MTACTICQAVTLPWPPRDLHPNARVHYMALSREKRAYRDACYWLTKQAGISIAPDARPEIAITFVPPDRRRRDVDGMLSAIKSGLDGFAQAAGCDDSRFRLRLDVADRIGGMVQVQVSC